MKTLLKDFKGIIIVILTFIFFITDIIAFAERDRIGRLAVLLVIVILVGNSVYLEKRRPTRKKYFDIREKTADETVSDNKAMSNRQGTLSIVSWSAAILAIVFAIVALYHVRIGVSVIVPMLIVHVVVSRISEKCR